LSNVSRVPHDLHVHYVRAEVVQWVDNEWPGWVEVHLREADGTVVSLVDKGPDFDDGDRLILGTTLPADVGIPCEVLGWAVDQTSTRSSLVRLRSNVQDQRGRTTFHVDDNTRVSRS
jgi:hypothetical protein